MISSVRGEEQKTGSVCGVVDIAGGSNETEIGVRKDQEIGLKHIEACVLAMTTRTVTVYVEPATLRNVPDYRHTYWRLDVPNLPEDCMVGELRVAIATALHCDISAVAYDDEIGESDGDEKHSSPRSLSQSKKDDWEPIYGGITRVRLRSDFVRPASVEVITETRGVSNARWNVPMFCMDNSSPRFLDPVSVFGVRGRRRRSRHTRPPSARIHRQHGFWSHTRRVSSKCRFRRLAAAERRFAAPL